METITIGGIKIFFCNQNKEMGLSGHCHFAEVEVEFLTTEEIGYPSFKHTNDEIRSFIRSLRLKGIKGTNEDVLRLIFNELRGFNFSETQKYDGGFSVHCVTLKVMGVEDENNHDDGFTVYKKWVK